MPSHPGRSSIRRACRAAWAELAPSGAAGRPRARAPEHPLRNLVGVGVGQRTRGGVRQPEPCLRFLVERKLPPRLLRRSVRLPRRVAGVPTDVVEIGRIHRGDGGGPAHPGPQEVLAAGSSVGLSPLGAEPPVTGTLGWVVADAAGQRYVLSNNHVLARDNAYAPGTTVEQPSPSEPGDSRAVARLTRLVALSTGEANVVDAAVARLAPGVRAVPAALDPRLGILHSAEVAAPRVGATVHKVGRTTGYTRGDVVATSAELWIDGYPFAPDGRLRFVRQILIDGVGEPFAHEGDSGSLVVECLSQRALGLLVGASRTTEVAVACPMRSVLSLLGVRLEV